LKCASFGVVLEECNPGIVAISETSLTHDISTSEFVPGGHHVFRKDRADSYSGVLLVCWNSITCQELCIDTNLEAVFCHVTLHNLQFVLFTDPEIKSNIDWKNIFTHGSAYSLALCDTVIESLQIIQVVNFPTRTSDTQSVL